MKTWAFIISCAGAAERGWAFMLTWNWFVAPAFSIREIGFWLAFALMSLPQIAVMRPSSTDDPDGSKWLKSAIVIAIAMPVFVGEMWVIHYLWVSLPS